MAEKPSESKFPTEFHHLIINFRLNLRGRKIAIAMAALLLVPDISRTHDNSDISLCLFEHVF